MRAPSILCAVTISLFAVSLPAFGGEMRGEVRSPNAGSLKDFSTRYGSLPGAGNMNSQETTVALAQSSNRMTRTGSEVTSRSASPNPAYMAAVVDHYGSMPGGIVLEGAAKGLENINSVRYDSKTQSLILGNDLSYKPEASMSVVAELARALAEDDRIGVSLTSDSVIAYGAIPEETELARDLSVADTFLADFIVPPREWTTGYRTAGGFEPVAVDSGNEIVAFYNFNDFSFEVRGGQVVPTGAKADIYVVPVLDERAEDGGYLPDLNALENVGATTVVGEVKKNADHVAANVSYYMGERAARRAIAFGEVAAVLRGLKSKGVNLETLADEIEEDLPETTVANWTSLDAAWTEYLREIQTAGDFANWSGPPLDLYNNRPKNQKEAAIINPQH